MEIVVDLVIRMLALGFSSGFIKNKLKAIRDAAGRDLTPQEYVNEMSQMAEVKAAEARAAVNG